MNSRSAIILLSLGVILLAGIAIAQYLALDKQTTSTERLKAEILAELRGEKQPAPAGQPLPAAQPGEPPVQGEVANQPPAPAPEPRPRDPVTQTEYWISTDISDDKRYGWSVWLQMVEGGQFIAERCTAPDYSGEVSALEEPFEMPSCATVVNTRVRAVTETALTLADGASMPMAFDPQAKTQKLTLTIDDDRIALEPGQKNTLWEGLSNLPSTKRAFEAAWKEFTRLQAEMATEGQTDRP